MLHMRHNFFCVATAVMFVCLGFVFAAVGLFGWEMIVNGWMVPQWYSWVVVGASFLMAYAGMHNVK
jgi:hypothetical protein